MTQPIVHRNLIQTNINVFRLLMFFACVVAFVALGVITFSTTLPHEFKAKALFLVLALAFGAFVFHD